MAVPTLNERSRCWTKAKFYDHNGASQTPIAIRYRLDCQTSGKALVDWTNVAIANTVEILIEAALNAIQNNGNPVERKCLTIQTVDDDGLPTATNVQLWDVVNLTGIT